MGQVSGKNNLPDADIEYIKANTTYDEQAIMKWWHNFQKDCPGGKMTPEQVTDMCKMVFPDLNMEDLGIHMARIFDTDQDGYVDFKEFMVGVDKTTHGTQQEKIKNVFRMFDVDGNKEISMKEMVQILKSSHNALFYRGKDVGIRNQAKQLFEKMDTDKDGNITEAEFVETVEKQPEFHDFYEP